MNILKKVQSQNVLFWAVMVALFISLFIFLGAFTKTAHGAQFSPQISLTLDGSSDNQVSPAGTSHELEWSTNMDSCYGGGDWSGSGGGSGTYSLGIPASNPSTPTYYAYSLNCMSGDTSYDPVTIYLTVQAGVASITLSTQPSTPPDVYVYANPSSGTAGSVNPNISWNVNGSVASVGITVNRAPYISGDPAGAGPHYSTTTVTSGTGLYIQIWPKNPDGTDNVGSICIASSYPSDSNFSGSFPESVSGNPQYAVIAPTVSTVYVVNCGSVSDTLTVNISGKATAPSVTHAASIPNTTSCTASVDWSGSRAVGYGANQDPNGNGTAIFAYQSQGILNTAKIYTYTLTCQGPGGSSSRSATVTVGLPPPPWGTISATSCTIANNASTCNSTLNWSTLNFSPTGTNPEVTRDNPANTHVAYGASGSNVSNSVNYGTSNFYLNHAGTALAQASIVAGCSGEGSTSDYISGVCRPRPTITVTQTANGTISPGTTTVVYASDQSFTITPDSGYSIATITIDGSPSSISSSKLFSNVTTNHTLTATYTASACPNGAIDPPTCSTCATGSAIIAGNCTALSVSVTATTPYNVLPAASVSFTYTPSTNSGSTECRLLDNSQTPLTSYQANSPITSSIPNGVGAYGYYVQCRNTTNTTVTAISNQITVNSSCGAGSDFVSGACHAELHITASAGANGTVTPAGTTNVIYNSSQGYTITPSGGYIVAGVLVDGSSVGAVGTYTFTNVLANHTISATFSASACSNGATNAPTCTTCATGFAMISGTCTAVTVSVTATTPINTNPSTAISFVYTPTTNSGATECRLLDNTQSALTSYQPSSPISATSPSSVGTYGYYVQCRNTTNTTVTAISNLITVNVSNAVPPPTMSCLSGSAFVTGKTLGTLRNDYGSWVGFKFTVGSTPIIVSSLGRIMVAGNTGTHTLKLVQGSDGSDVSGGSTSVTMTGGTAGQFVYGNLASPVTLSANASYYLMSQEVSSGDQWYDDNTTLTTSSAATVNSSAFWAGFWAVNTSGSHSYVPESFCSNTGGTIPTLTTSATTNITDTTATSGGTITSNGGSTVTVSGITWSTSANPTYTPGGTTQTTDGFATGGPWTDSITGLTASTTYHVRAYAVNTAGTGYGSDVTFTTTAPVVMSGTLLPANPTCTIASGQSSCTQNLIWTTTNPVAVSAVTSATGTPSPATGNNGNQTFTVPYNAGGVNFYLYNNAVMLAQSSVSTVCTGGTAWSGSACTAGGSMSGTLTPSSPTCTIASGQSSCTQLLTWTTTNPIGTSAVTSATGTPSPGTSANNGSQTFTAPYNVSGVIFNLYNNAQLLAQSTVTTACAGGTNWNGSTCANIPPPNPTASLTCSPSSISSGGSTTCTWSSANATACTASASPADSNWSGSKATSNSIGVNLSPTVTTTYTLNCNNGVVQSPDSSQTITVGGSGAGGGKKPIYIEK